MLPNKSSLANGRKSSSHMTVRFQIDDTNEFHKEKNNKRQTRKKVTESFVCHEIQAWSSFFDLSTTEKIVTNINKKSNNQCLQKVLVDNQSFSSISEERSNRYRSALIGRNKHHYHHCNEITWRSLLGTMSDINQILMGKYFIRPLSYIQTLIVFIDSCFRGMGQVVFANNPLSGLVSLKPNIS